MLGVVYQLKAVNLKREGKFSESLQYGEMALNIFKNENRTNYYLQTLYQLREIAAKDFNYEKAYQYALEYEKHQDSINAKELDNNLKDLRLKYETAEKELKIAQQQKDIIKTESRQKTTTIIATSLGILSLLIFLIYRQRQKTQKQKIVSLENEKENIALKSLMAGEEKERSRIAKELHDGIGSLLAASKMHASALLTKDPEASETLISLLDNASNEARRISHNLLPESLINKGLDVALQDFVETINEGKLLQVEYQSINFKHNLPQSTQLTIYRIVQELLNNIIKHSGATEAFVQLNQNDKKLIITVEDNGRGFSGGTDFKGIGLQNIESRLSLLNGKIEVDSKETMGTSVYIEFEIEK
jgi:signal transduction histidine kinase